MRHLRVSRPVVICVSVALLLIGTAAVTAQTSAPVLVTQAVDDNIRISLPGNVHPLARPGFDRGVAPPDLPMNRILLVLRRSPEQEAAVRNLIEDQQDSFSPRFHHWVTPQEFGAKYGPSDSDISAVINWLKASGFAVSKVSSGRTVIEFNGSAALVKQAFGTEIHRFALDGQQHWANATNPTIPRALSAVVAGIVSLNNFPRRPHSSIVGTFSRTDDGQFLPLSPLYTITAQGQPYFGISPADFATIYNVPATMDGSGQTIAIVGETNINLDDVRTFRSIFGLPANDPTVTVNGPDPGILNNGEETEALLDVSWSGAVAKKATINFVVSGSTETTYGTDLSALYIVDNNLAPVMSESYGACEQSLGNAGNAFYNALWQQAAAQGITVLLSSGDGGSAGCDNFNNAQMANLGLAVSGYASTPYNVSVGGTDFDLNASNASSYWNTSNTSQGASAKSYIREIPWNDSCSAIELGSTGCVGNNLQFLDIIGGSGGQSNCAFQDNSGKCQGGYPKPAWQTGTGVRRDGVRDSPDVSLFASNGFNHSFYMLCEADALRPYICNIGSQYAFLAIGGTSASAPAFAGVMALVNQKTGGRQGNANYVLYKLASQAGASCDSTALSSSQLTSNSCIFYDTTKGNNAVPCNSGSPNCGAPPPGGYGVLVDPADGKTPAWTTTRGYDMATGLGSVNVANLVNKWSTATFSQSTTTLSNLSPVTVTHGQPVNVSINVASKSGVGTPTGSVSLMAAPNGTTLALDSFTLANGVATGTTQLLPGGTYNITAHYTGDGVFGGSDSAPVQVTVGKEQSRTFAALLDMYRNPTNTSIYGATVYLHGSVSNSAGAACDAPPGQLSCPSGSVTFTNDGTPLDANTYRLDATGHFADDVVLIPAGNHTIQTHYSGDNSFNSSSTSQSVTINQADTFLQPNVPAQVTVNQPFTVSTRVSTLSQGLAPSGSVTLLLDGKPLPGTPQQVPHNGAPGDYAYLDSSLQVTVNKTGNHTIAATYSGDANYQGASISSTTDTVFAIGYFNYSANTQAVTYGTSVTLTAVIGGSSSNIAPSGAIMFQSDEEGTLPGTVSYTTITDGAGKLALQATLTFVPQFEQNITSRFLGDVNYPPAQSSNTVSVSITDASFSISPISNISVKRGDIGLAVVILNPIKGFIGAIDLTCSLPQSMAEATCPAIHDGLTKFGASGENVLIHTTGPHQLASTHTNLLWLHGLVVVAGIFPLALGKVRQKLLAILIFVTLMVVASCGGGGGGGGGGGVQADPGTPPGTYLVTITATGGGVTQTGTFNVTVQ